MTPNLKYDLYVAHPVSTTGEFNDSIRLAKRIKEETKQVAEIYADGRTRYEQVYEVYAPALNKEINDKSNNPTPQMIYEQDMEQLDNADVVVVNYTGACALGTLLELSTLGAYYQKVKQITNEAKELKDELLADSILNSIEKQWFKGYRSGVEKFVGKFIKQQLEKLPKVYVYTSNKRTIQPQLYNLKNGEQYDPNTHGNDMYGFVASGSENHMILGMIEQHLIWCESEDEVIQKLKEL